MNNPLEFILRKQKMAQGGRIHLRGGGMDMGNQASQDKSANMGGNYGGNQIGNKDRERTDYNANRATTDAALERLDTTGSSALADDTTGNNQTTTTTTPQNNTQYTNNFLDALFNKDLSFKFDPKMDYVNRVYGGLSNVQKNKILNQIDPTGDLFGGDFDAFSSMAANDLYSNDNFSIKGAYNSMKDYFTGIPDKIANYSPTMPTQEGLVDLAKKVGYQGFFNPAMAAITGNPIGLFGSIVFGKGPYNLAEDGTYNPELGDIANLTNAPANYVDAISNYQGGLTGEQMAQVASGMAAKAEEQANTRGREMSAEEQAALKAQMDAQSKESYKNTLDEQQLRVYERLEGQGYNDDYIRAYLGFI